MNNGEQISFMDQRQIDDWKSRWRDALCFDPPKVCNIVKILEEIKKSFISFNKTDLLKMTVGNSQLRRGTALHIFAAYNIDSDTMIKNLLSELSATEIQDLLEAKDDLGRSPLLTCAIVLNSSNDGDKCTKMLDALSGFLTNANIDSAKIILNYRCDAVYKKDAGVFSPTESYSFIEYIENHWSNDIEKQKIKDAINAFIKNGGPKITSKIGAPKISSKRPPLQQKEPETSVKIASAATNKDHTENG